MKRTKVFVCTKTREEVEAKYLGEDERLRWWGCPTCGETWHEVKPLSVGKEKEQGDEH